MDVFETGIMPTVERFARRVLKDDDRVAIALVVVEVTKDRLSRQCVGTAGREAGTRPPRSAGPEKWHGRMGPADAVAGGRDGRAG